MATEVSEIELKAIIYDYIVYVNDPTISFEQYISHLNLTVENDDKIKSLYHMLNMHIFR